MARLTAFKTGHQKSSPLETVVPAPSGKNFIPASQRGPRPELPHKTYSAYEESEVTLTPQQKKENDHIAIQQKNWDSHKDLEDTAALEQAKANNFHEVDESQLSESDYAALGMSASGQHHPLLAAHGALSDALSSMGSHLGSQDEVVRGVRAASTSALNQLQELSMKHAGMRAKGRAIPPKQEEKMEDLKAFVGNSTTFPQKHIRAVNRAATVRTYLDKAQSLIGANRTADAADILSQAHSELHSMAKHLTHPTTVAAYQKIGVQHSPVDTTSIEIGGGILRAARSPRSYEQEGEEEPNLGPKGSGIGRTRGPRGEPPVIKIGKPGRLKGDKGSLEQVRADKDGITYVTKKYGTSHPYTQKVRQAHIAWRGGRAGNKAISEIMRSKVETVPEAAARTAAETAKETELKASPKQQKIRNDELVGHMQRIHLALKNGAPLPGDSVDALGRDNVMKIIQHHNRQQGEA
jgi:hypothetical protein